MSNVSNRASTKAIFKRIQIAHLKKVSSLILVHEETNFDFIQFWKGWQSRFDFQILTKIIQRCDFLNKETSLIDDVLNISSYYNTVKILIIKDIDCFAPMNVQFALEREQKLYAATLFSLKELSSKPSTVVIATIPMLKDIPSALMDMFTYRVQFSGSREVEEQIESSDLSISNVFGDFQGYFEQKKLIWYSLILPAMNPRIYIDRKISFPRGILFYGESGNGKSFFISEIMKNCNALNFILADSVDLISKIVGESEKNIANLFLKARSESPAAIVIDNIEGLSQKRYSSDSVHSTFDRILSTFLVEMDGISTKKEMKGIEVVVIGLTSRVEDIDKALLRPGRFDVKIEFSFPTEEDRKSILQALFANSPIEYQTFTREKLALSVAKNTEYLSVSRIKILWKEFIMAKLRNEDFLSSLCDRDIEEYFSRINS